MKKLMVFLMCCCSMLTRESAASNVVAPEAASGDEGNSALSPFSRGVFRMQQVYSASLFSAFPDGINIGSVAFRGDRDAFRPGGVTISDVEIHLSTTSMPIDGLSSTFSLNVGPDDRIVRTRDPFRMVFTGGGGVVPSGWILSRPAVDIQDRPFYYNPAAGNLLLDIRVDGSILGATALDAVSTLGDSVSSVYSVSGSPAGTGTLDTLGLATWFYFEPVPEPSTVTLLLLGLGVVVFAGSFRSARARGSLSGRYLIR
ncbi:MAG TPA: PEP-CTERM sorting domain-containing protein [Verrucomicrobiae bacterium]|nr:PEP-CTERM sorting domain-containing protein [Verrucomicrobiae bacterium]